MNLKSTTANGDTRTMHGTTQRMRSRSKSPYPARSCDNLFHSRPELERGDPAVRSGWNLPPDRSGGRQQECDREAEREHPR